MKLQECKFLADENIHPEVVDTIRVLGWDVVSVREVGWTGKEDRVVLFLANEQGRVVLTHDSDFGRLAIADGEAYLGIVYLRPGHIQPELTLQTIYQLLEQPLELPTPFILVAERSLNRIKIRVRPRLTDQASP